MNNKIEEIIRDEEAVWEQRKLDDVVEFLDTMRKPLEGAKRISGSYPYYGASGIVDYVDGYLFDEELILLSEDGANITDRNYPVCFLASGKYWVNNHAHVLRTKKENENNFICNSLERKDYTQYNTGMAMPKLNKETCRKIPILCPAFEEQQKIGDYFRSLDHLITLHQRISLYFLKINTFVWEQRKLSEFVDKAVDNRGKTPPLDENGTHPLIEVAALGGVHPNYSKVDKYLSDDSFENNLRAYIKKGDILFTTVGSIGLVSLMDSREEAAIAQNIVAFRAKENFIPEYLYALFSNEENQYKANRIVMGAVQPSIKVSQLVDVEYMLTRNVKEQKKIGSFFSNIDNLITLHQRKPYFWNKFIVIDWEQRKLGDILISLQNNTLSRADLSNEAGVAKNVHYGDVLIKFGEVLDVSKEKLPMISDESVLSKYKSSFLQNGDVIVADTAEDSTVGKCSEIAGLNDEVVLSGLHTIPYRPIEKFASGYLGYYLNSSAYHNQLIPLMQGIKVASISKSAMQDTDIVYPKSVKEQGKIGDYFQSLDHLITLHHHKLFIINELKVFTVMQCKCHLLLNISNKNKKTKKEIKLMPELERVIEEKLIDQLVYGDSQWTYREDLKTEEDL